MTCDLYYIFSPGPLSIPASLLNGPPWRNKIYLSLPYKCGNTNKETWLCDMSCSKQQRKIIVARILAGILARIIAQILPRILARSLGILDGNTPLTIFHCQPNLPPFSRPDSVKLPTTLHDNRHLRLKGIPNRTNYKTF